MMRKSDKPLKQINKATGFQYLNNFSRAFKRYYQSNKKGWENK